MKIIAFSSLALNIYVIVAWTVAFNNHDNHPERVAEYHRLTMNIPPLFILGLTLCSLVILILLCRKSLVYLIPSILQASIGFLLFLNLNLQ